MAAAEAAAFRAGTDSFAVMRRAGEGVAAALHALAPGGDIRVLCGPGGNGGDGFVAAAWLAARGRDVRVHAMTDPGGLSGDPARAAALWRGQVAPLAAAVGAPAAVTLDALFGGGLSRPLAGAAAALAAETVGLTVSVDVPSGIDGGAARALGAHFTADLTVTFQALRHAHVFAPARRAAGRVDVVEIGIAVASRLWQVSRETLEADPDAAGARLAGGEVAGDRGAAERVSALRARAAEEGRAQLWRGEELVLVRPGGEALVAPVDAAPHSPGEG